MPNSIAQAFADHAVALVEGDYDRPKIATVQSLAILSCYEGLRTRDARGWLYAGTPQSLPVANTLLSSSSSRHGYEISTRSGFTYRYQRFRTCWKDDNQDCTSSQDGILGLVSQRSVYYSRSPSV